MSNLKYHGLTILVKDDSFKNDVFFAACDKDIRYREQLLQAIQETRARISYWYLENPECLETAEEREQFFDDFAHMKLVVVPITSEFLFSQNYAKDIVIPRCIEKHIPLLPIMMESGLAESFNYACGDIQFLEFSSYDTSAVSFQVKLNNFINEILLTDERISAIRGAFASYIFLSYRKKDRKEAQEIMSRIHACDGCEDIAIWYDEFLTPGEDFNLSILEAMKKSKLFAMVVTPNLLETANYVAEKEYPEAQRLGKTILPIMARPTDYEKFFDMFRLTRDCIKTIGELEDALNPMIPDTRMIWEPEKQFLLGLAYLNGIDVELDPERAIRLLTSAAERNYMDAVRQLIFVYDNGFGAPRDEQQALKWAKIYRSLLEQESQNEPVHVWNLISCTHDLAKRSLGLNEIFRSLEYYSTAIDLIVQNIKLDFMRDYRVELSELLLNLYMELSKTGEVTKYQGKKECEAVLQKTRNAMTSLVKDGCFSDIDDDSIPPRRMAITKMLVGVISRDHEDIRAAVENFRSIIAETNMDAARRDLFTCYSHLADVLFISKAEISEIMEAYDQQQQIFTQLLNPTYEDKIKMANSLRKKADLLFKAMKSDTTGEYKKLACQYYREASDILEGVLRKQEYIGALEELFFCFRGLFDLGDEEENIEDKRRYAQRCYEISDGLTQKAPCSYVYLLKADACCDRMLVCYFDKDFKTAKECRAERAEAVQKASDITTSKLFKMGFELNYSLYTDNARELAVEASHKLFLVVAAIFIFISIMLILHAHIIMGVIFLALGALFVYGYFYNGKHFDYKKVIDGYERDSYRDEGMNHMIQR